MATTTFANLSIEQLKRAVVIREQIDALERQLADILGGAGKPRSGRGQMSASGRARIAAAQKLRWAKLRSGKQQADKGSTKSSPKRKRHLSPAARERIAAAQRQRWAEAKRTA